MRHYYAVENTYGNETSIGFSNTWYPVVFNSKKERDEYVKENHWKNISIRAVKRSDLVDYGCGAGNNGTGKYVIYCQRPTGEWVEIPA